MTNTKRILFAGYAPVHFLCFLPVYELLRNDPRLEIWLSGGFQRKEEEGIRYELEGFYDPYPVDRDRVTDFDRIRHEAFDVLVSAHSSTDFFPRSVGRSVQIFHGVSFKNFGIREKTLRHDILCLPGRYHAEQFGVQGLLDTGDAEFLLTGFPKVDRLVADPKDREERLKRLGLDPARPTVLYAPTGGKHNSLDSAGEEIIAAIAGDRRWNLLVKPHDHPKKAVDWFTVLAPREDERVKLVRDLDVVPYLRAADCLLTDASSVSMEYSLLDRPMVFFDVPELLGNVMKRGGALDLASYGRRLGTIAGSAAEVVPCIAGALANPGRESELRRRAARHMFHEPGNAAANVAGVVLHAAGLRSELPEGVERVSATRSGV
ncbi:MAG: CDP-glycerol glycerophosphotransferase family protein [Planctomycetota bacterium]